MIYFNITFACNNLCIFCAANFYGNSLNKSPDLHTKDFKRILTQLGVQSGDYVVISGGEPTVHDDFFELLALVRDSGAQPILLTNGVTLSNKNLAKRIAKFHPIGICMPFVGATAERHDFLIGRPGNFRRTLEGFSNVIHLIGEGWDINLEARLLLSKATSAENIEIADLLVGSFERFFCFSLNRLIISRKVMENKDLLIESFSAMKLDTQATIDYITVSGFDVEVKGVPFCILDKRHESLLPALREDFGGSYYFDRRLGEQALATSVPTELCSNKCRPCLYKNTCRGFCREYLDIFGTDEIRPFLERGPHVL
jgi:uncharacterized Fe-S cluster-containing radical SAM superfamily protein